MPELSVDGTFAHYRIRARLGSGGMGDVYLAEDLRLHRPVALKVLRSGESEALERVLREARAASALNHPNAAHIYEAGQVGELAYIAMEYVEGTTLESRLEGGPLPTAEAINIAIQIADALQEAGSKGIVHRDLKPANIVINQRGQVKILDFGIARMNRPGASGPSKESLPSTLVGTVPYMSPEQARGKPVDHRSDIFGFGIILHEMVTGVRPFDGSGILETLQNIAEAKWQSHGGVEVPHSLEPILNRCLKKERESRYASADAIVADLRAVEESSRPPVSPRAERRRIAVIAIAAGLVGIAVIIAAVIAMRSRPDRAFDQPRLTKLTAAAGLEDEPAISPDGRSVAYTSDERGNLDIFVRPISGGEPVRITDHKADDAQPAWSPDGKRIAFVSARERNGRLSIVLGQALGNFVNGRGGDIFIVPATGGTPIKLVDDGFYPSWSPDGKWIAFQSGRGGRRDLWKIPSAGGAAVQLTSNTDFDYQPSWSRDGKWIVYASGMPDPYRLKIIPAGGGAPRVISDGKDGVLLKPVFADGSKSLIYSSTRGGSLNLWVLPLNASMQSAGVPRRLTLGTGDDVNPSIAADGKRIIYSSVRQTPDLWTLHPGSGASEQLTFDTGAEEFPHRSIDGVIVFSSDRGGRNALWLLDASGKLKELVISPHAGQPRWARDGRRIAYRFADHDVTVVAVREVDRTEVRIIARNAESPSWSPDGKRLAFSSWENEAKAQIFIAPSEGNGERQQVTFLDLTTSYPTWSPDGRFLSFQATRDDGTRHVWMVELATGEARPLTEGFSEDSHPQWSPVDPDRILFVRNHENLMTVSVSTGEIESLTHYAEPNMVLDYPSWSPDGIRIDFSIARKQGDLYILESE